MNHPEHVAWTGGSEPAPIRWVSTPERVYVYKLFRADIAVWEEYWKEKVPADVRAIFWNRARGDAHATYRAAARVEA